MKIAILSRKTNLYSTQRLMEAAKKRGHDPHVIDTLRCYMNIAADIPSIHYKGVPLGAFDAVVPRIGASITFYGTAVVRQFEMMGTFCVNDSMAIAQTRDKLRCLQLLSGRGIGLPMTGFARAPEDINDLIQMIGGAPFVVKMLEGTQGVGVVLAETKSAARSVVEAFCGLRVNILIQEYIKEAGGVDIRCIVVGNEVVAAIERRAQADDFRSNLHRGGQAVSADISEAERQLAVDCAKITGLRVAGVDFIRSKRGPLVMEVNSSPGLRGVEAATQVDVASAIIQYIERHAAAKQ